MLLPHPHPTIRADHPVRRGCGPQPAPHGRVPAEHTGSPAPVLRPELGPSESHVPHSWVRHSVCVRVREAFRVYFSLKRQKLLARLRWERAFPPKL